MLIDENELVNQTLPTDNVDKPDTSINLPEQVAGQIIEEPITQNPSSKPPIKKPYENIIAFCILFILLYICLDSLGFI